MRKTSVSDRSDKKNADKYDNSCSDKWQVFSNNNNNNENTQNEYEIIPSHQK